MSTDIHKERCKKKIVCPECKDRNLKSLVYIGNLIIEPATVIRFPYYDEEGEYHSHDLSISRQSYSCSHGHSWAIKESKTCPNTKCHWTQR